MGINNRTADRQPHPHALWLGGEEGLEEPVRPRRVDPEPQIRSRNKHVAGFVISGSDLYPPLPMRGIRHRLDAVHHQIQDDLLKLDSIAHDRTKIGRQGGFDPYAVAAKLAAHKDDHFPDHFVDIKWDHFGRRLAREGSDALDDFAGAVAVSHNASRGPPRFL